MTPARLERSLTYEQLYALIKARGRRLERDYEYQYERLRIVVAALGSELPPFRKHAASTTPTAKDVDRQLAALERRGIKVIRK